jgi:transposase
MARPKEVIDRKLAEKARIELGKITDYRLCQKLRAIVSSLDHPIKVVAQINGVGPDTIWRWIICFRQEGIEGLKDKPKGHRSSKLSEVQWQEVESWLKKSRDAQGNPIHWTLFGLQVHIAKEFKIDSGITSLWYQVHKRNFKLKVPRPVHGKADKEAQAAFKKKRSRKP